MLDVKTYLFLNPLKTLIQNHICSSLAMLRNCVGLLYSTVPLPNYKIYCVMSRPCTAPPCPPGPSCSPCSPPGTSSGWRTSTYSTSGTRCHYIPEMNPLERTLMNLNFSKKIPHTGNTRPSRMCVIQEYQYYTITELQFI